MIDLSAIIGFDWDEGNSRKNNKHRVSAEQVFFNAPLLLLADLKHSQQEPRFHALGRTHQDRLLHITFTLHQQNTHIRVISVRDMHKKERSIYEQAS
jgi:uncharacterized DUF497 family protein